MLSIIELIENKKSARGHEPIKMDEWQHRRAIEIGIEMENEVALVGEP